MHAESSENRSPVVELEPLAIFLVRNTVNRGGEEEEPPH